MTTPAQAQNRTGELVGSAIGLIGGVILGGKAARETAAMSMPLQYESDLPPPDPANPSDPRNMDVAGVRLGMTAEEANRQLRARRFEITSTFEAPSFASRVRAGLPPVPGGHLVENLPLEVEAKGANDQHISLTMAMLPDGPVVRKVNYRMDSRDMSSEAFAAQALRKYGEAPQGGAQLTWCTGVDGLCRDGWRSRPYLIVTPGPKEIQLADEDPARDAALQQRLDDEIAARRPKIENAGF